MNLLSDLSNIKCGKLLGQSRLRKAVIIAAPVLVAGAFSERGKRLMSQASARWTSSRIGRAACPSTLEKMDVHQGAPGA